MSSRLAEKVCIITGAGGTMGREAALTFAREGALVVGCDLHADDAEATVQAVRAAGGTMVSLHPCDLTKPSECQALVDLAVRTFGRIDVLFNNAAMAYLHQSRGGGGLRRLGRPRARTDAEYALLRFC